MMIIVYTVMSCRLLYTACVPLKLSEPNPNVERIFAVKILEEFRPSP